MAILGTGKMGRALSLGLSKSKAPFEYILFNPTQSKAEELARDIGATVLADLEKINNVDIIMLACRPQQFNQLAAQLKHLLKGDEVILSVMAAISVEKISARLGSNKIVRMMPNTPNKIGLGANLFYFSPNVGLPDRSLILNSFSAFSSVFNLEKEDQLDICTAFTGSGPALVFEWARALVDVMVERGIAKVEAEKMIAQTFLGAATLLAKTGKTANELKAEVTSKGGVTIEALNIFDQSNMQQIISQATMKAYQRGKEIEESL